MAKYRILKHEYPNGQIEYEVQKKLLEGLGWMGEQEGSLRGALL